MITTRRSLLKAALGLAFVPVVGPHMMLDERPKRYAVSALDLAGISEGQLYLDTDRGCLYRWCKHEWVQVVSFNPSPRLGIHS